MNALIFAATGIALTLLALAMTRHFHRVFHKAPQGGIDRGLRLFGWLFLVGSLGATALGWNGGIGLVLWTATLAFHVFGLSLVIASKPRWTPFWPAACLALALLSTLT